MNYFDIFLSDICLYAYFTTCNFRVCSIFAQTACTKIKPMVSSRKRCAKIKTRENKTRAKELFLNYVDRCRLLSLQQVLVVIANCLVFNVSFKFQNFCLW